MKTILLIMLLAVPAMAQKKVREITLPEFYAEAGDRLYSSYGADGAAWFFAEDLSWSQGQQLQKLLRVDAKGNMIQGDIPVLDETGERRPLRISQTGKGWILLIGERRSSDSNETDVIYLVRIVKGVMQASVLGFNEGGSVESRFAIDDKTAQVSVPQWIELQRNGETGVVHKVVLWKAW